MLKAYAVALVMATSAPVADKNANKAEVKELTSQTQVKAIKPGKSKRWILF